MTYSAVPTPVSGISLQEYMQDMAGVDLTDEESVFETAGALAGLATDHRLLTRAMNDQLSDWANFQRANRYSATSLILDSGDGYFVRANVWLPVASEVDSHQLEDSVSSYEIPHDHNFTFLTVGYIGPGYRTRIWEYDPSTVIGLPGEHVDLTFLEETHLEPGKVMLYRASRDVHTQARPEALSVSLNLMISDQEKLKRDQFYFDTDKGLLDGTVLSDNTGRLLMCDLAGLVGDDETLSLLDSLAEGHPADRVRWHATEAAAQLHPDAAGPRLERALRDESRLVRASAAAATR